jgi:hypothetical protein
MSPIHSSKYPIGRWTLWKQDIVTVSAFVVWAVVLGLIPVLVFSALSSLSGHGALRRLLESSVTCITADAGLRRQ